MPHRLSGHAALDSLSNLAASLNAGKDKQAGDAFFIPTLARDQIESLYRGDWLARKIVDIVPYDCVREWRAWDGECEATHNSPAGSYKCSADILITVPPRRRKWLGTSHGERHRMRQAPVRDS